MTQQHTPAMRAARALTDDPASMMDILVAATSRHNLMGLGSYPDDHATAEQSIAEIIDRETGVSDLLAALEDCVTDDGEFCINQATQSNVDGLTRRIQAINTAARAAIAKAKGE